MFLNFKQSKHLFHGKFCGTLDMSQILIIKMSEQNNFVINQKLLCE